MFERKKRHRLAMAILLLGIILFLPGITAEAKTKGTLTVGTSTFPAEFENNTSAKAFLKMFPLTVKMSELNGNEKYKYLQSELPTNEQAVKEIKAGDIMLYGSDCVVLFYESFSTDYKYIRLGRITDTSGLSKALGTGSAKVIFSIVPALNRKKVTLEEGEAFKLKLAGASSKTVKWKSSNKKIASVSNTGIVTAKKKGKATVTAVHKKKKYKCTVTVKPASQQSDSDSEEQKPSDNGSNNIPVSAKQPESTGGGSDSILDNSEQPESSSDGSDKTPDERKEYLTLKIADRIVEVDWEENESVEALKDICREKPITIQMSMYGGFEQVGSIGTNLPRNDVQITTQAGDIVLYSGSNLVVFYGSNSWAYTKLGRIPGLSETELKELLGNGDVAITIF